MSYVMVRMYTGENRHSGDEILQIVGSELAPQVMKSGGCHRYTLVKFSDGSIGTTSLYIDKEAADRAAKVAARWVQGTAAAQGYTLSRTMGGETVFSFHASDASLQNTFGVMRVYASRASMQDVKDAVEQEALPIFSKIPDLLRWTCFKLEQGGGYVILTANKTQASAANSTQHARAASGKSGSRLQTVFPKAPEIIEGELIHSYTS